MYSDMMVMEDLLSIMGLYALGIARSWTREPFPILMLVAPSAPAKPPGNRSLVCSLLFLPVRIMQPEGCASSVKRALSSVGHGCQPGL